MSEGNVELTTAYVTLIPSMQGAEKTITDQLVPAAEQAGTKAGEKAGGGFSTSMKAFVAVAGVAAIGKTFYDIGAQFDAMSDTIRAGTGATGANLDSLLATAQKVGTEAPASWSQIGPVITDLNTRLGLTGDNLEMVARQVIEAGGMTGEALNIDTLSAAFNAFGLTADDVSGAMDTLWQVSQSTGVGMNELASTVQAQAPALQNLGFSFQDSAAMAGILDKAGLNASATMAAMGKGLVTLAKQGENPQEAFKRVTAQIEALVKQGDIAGAIDLASGIFGTKAANQFIGAVQSGQLSLDNLMGSLSLSGDTILGAAADTASFAENWQVVKNNAELAMQPIAATIFDALSTAVGALLPYLQQFGAWLANNQWVLGVVAGVIGVTLVAAFIAWTASIWAATAALLANPITWIIIGIAALAVGIVELVKHWDEVVSWLKSVWGACVDWVTGTLSKIGDWFSRTWQAVKDAVVGAVTGAVDWVRSKWQAASDWLSSLLSTIGGFFTQAWQDAKNAVVNAVTAAVDWVRSKWQSACDWVSSTLSKIRDFFVNTWQGAKDAVVGAVTGAVEWVMSKWQAASSWLSSALSNIKGFFVNAWQGAKDSVVSIATGLVTWVTGLPGRIVAGLGSLASGVRNVFTTAFSTVAGIVKAPINAVIALINKAISGLNSISVDIPSWVPVVGGKHFGINLPQIAMLAAGATILPSTGGTLAVLAEAGKPETIVDTGRVNTLIEQVNARLDVDKAEAPDMTQVLALLAAILKTVQSGQGIYLDGKQLIGATTPGYSQSLQSRRDQASMAQGGYNRLARA